MAVLCCEISMRRFVCLDFLDSIFAVLCYLWRGRYKNQDTGMLVGRTRVQRHSSVHQVRNADRGLYSGKMPAQRYVPFYCVILNRRLSTVNSILGMRPSDISHTLVSSSVCLTLLHITKILDFEIPLSEVFKQKQGKGRTSRFSCRKKISLFKMDVDE